MKQQIKEPNESLLSQRALATRWNCSIMHLWRMRRQGKLKPILIGSRSIRFRLSDIQKLEEQGTV